MTPSSVLPSPSEAIEKVREVAEEHFRGHRVAGSSEPRVCVLVCGSLYIVGDILKALKWTVD